MRRVVTGMLLAIPGLGWAVPVTTLHEGRVLSSNGAPLEGTFDVAFKLWAAQTGGASPVWSESFNDVPLSNGFYSVELGRTSPLEAQLVAANLWLSVAIDGGPDLAPRDVLGAAPYAIVARNVSGGTVQATSVTTGALDATTAGIGTLTANQVNVGSNVSISANGTVNAGQLQINGSTVINASGQIAASSIPTGVGGSCYVRWGAQDCAAPFTAVLTGRAGGIESFTDGSALYGNVSCVSGSAAVTTTWASGYNTRMMRGDADANGMIGVSSQCAVCCTGGCYTALGTNSCASGYTRVVDGRVGGVEAYHGAQIYGDTLCVGSDIGARYTWASGYDTRLMRHRDVATNGNSGGMESVTNSCATCCK
jgi:hypothetical protein